MIFIGFDHRSWATSNVARLLLREAAQEGLFK
jgi:hypothetical protein